MISKDFSKTKVSPSNELILSEKFPSISLVILFLSIGIISVGFQLLQELKVNIYVLPELTKPILLVCACIFILGGIFLIITSLKIIFFRNDLLLTNSEVVVHYYFLIFKYKTKVYENNGIILDFYYKNRPTIQPLREKRYYSRIILRIGETMIAVRYLFASFTYEDFAYVELLSKYNISLSDSVKNLLEKKLSEVL